MPSLPGHTQPEGSDGPLVRRFTAVETGMVEDLLVRAHHRIAAEDPEQVGRTPITALLQSFGPWRRVAPPVAEPMGQDAIVIFRSSETNDYALVPVPDPLADIPYSGDHIPRVVEAVGERAVAGEVLALWRWALDARPPLSATAMVFADRLSLLHEGERLLAAFSLLPDTYTAHAQVLRPGVYPTMGQVRSVADRVLWQVQDETRDDLARQAWEAAQGFVDRLPAVEVAQQRVELGTRVATFLEEWLTNVEVPGNAASPHS